MTEDFLARFIENEGRARILRLFLFNQSESFTMGAVTKRAHITLKTAVREIRALEKLELIKKGKVAIALFNGKRVVEGNQKEQTWILNGDSKHVRALSKFVHEISPIQHKSIITILQKSGRLTAVILSGSFMGDPTRPADLIVVADGLNERRLEAAARTLEPSFGREIRYAGFTTPEFRYRMTIQDRLLRDTLDFPHLVLLDRTRLL
jgi:hypothetical protein